MKQRKYSNLPIKEQMRKVKRDWIISSVFSILCIMCLLGMAFLAYTNGDKDNAMYLVFGGGATWLGVSLTITIQYNEWIKELKNLLKKLEEVDLPK